MLPTKQNLLRRQQRAKRNHQRYCIYINMAGRDNKTYFAGTVNIATAGYVKVELKGISKTGNYFGDVSDIMIGGTATEPNLAFANDPANFYWSRRGPSCHLNYTTPAADMKYFYSELTVPAREDKIASYFMTNGFGEGYFGIQVNSATERRILFSVWDPAEGQGQTTLLRKGPDVTAGRFGGEGTGGQSYLMYNWKAGTSYKFLTKAMPDGAGSTVYTAWFFASEQGSWRLISSWIRPNISKYLTGFHGFLENFDPSQGYLSRKAAWSNQWVRLASGSWSEVTEFKFTVDATAANKQRLDCTGGVENGQFFLKNGGFFSNGVAPQTLFTKPATGIPPVIDFNALPYAMRSLYYTRDKRLNHLLDQCADLPLPDIKEFTYPGKPLLRLQTNSRSSTCKSCLKVA